MTALDKDTKPHVNEHGVNTAIQFHEKPAAQMRDDGFHTFTSNDIEYWSYSKEVADTISFWVHWPVGSTEQGDLQIDVIDDEFGQPYDYQYILSRNPTFPFALKVKAAVESEMERLQLLGILSGHVKGDYI